MENVLTDLTVELSFLIFLLLCEIIMLVYRGVKSIIDKKTALSKEQMKESYHWLFVHCNKCMADISKESNVCVKCGKVTTSGFIKVADKIEKRRKTVNKWLIRIVLLAFVVMILLVVTGAVPIETILDFDEGLSLFTILNGFKENIIGCICFYAVIVVGCLFFAADFVYEGLDNKYWKKVTNNIIQYQREIKTNSHSPIIIDEKMIEKNTKEKERYLVDEQKMRKIIRNRYLIFLVVVVIGLGLSYAAILLIIKLIM